MLLGVILGAFAPKDSPRLHLYFQRYHRQFLQEEQGLVYRVMSLCLAVLVELLYFMYYTSSGTEKKGSQYLQYSRASPEAWGTAVPSRIISDSPYVTI